MDDSLSDASYSFTNGRGHCHVCNIELTSHQHCQQHVNGKQHQKAKQNRMFGNVSNDYQSNSNLETSGNVAQLESYQGSVAPSQFQQSSEKDETYYLSNGRGHCNACNLELTSVQHCQQHINGKQHQKARQNSFASIGKGTHQVPQMNSFTSPPQSDQGLVASEQFNPNGLSGKDESYYLSHGRGRCNVCNIELTSAQHCQQHINGKQHLKSRQRSMAGASFSFQQSSPMPPIGTMPQSSSSQSASQNLPQDLLQGMAGGKLVMCSLCDVPFSGPANIIDHLKSERHLRKVREQSGVGLNNNASSGAVGGDERQDSRFESFDQTIPKTCWQPDSCVLNEGTHGQTAQGRLNLGLNTPVQFTSKSPFDPKPTQNHMPTSQNSMQTRTVDESQLNLNLNQSPKVGDKGVNNLSQSFAETVDHNQETVSGSMGSIVNNELVDVGGFNMNSNIAQVERKIGNFGVGSKPIWRPILGAGLHDKDIKPEFVKPDIFMHDPQGSLGNVPQTHSTYQSGQEVLRNSTSQQSIPEETGNNSSFTQNNPIEVVQNNISRIPQNTSLREQIHLPQVPARVASISQTSLSVSHSNNGLSSQEHEQAQSHHISSPVDQGPCPEIYVFNGVSGYCNACEVDLTSTQLARQHLSGQKHKKKVDQLKHSQNLLVHQRQMSPQPTGAIPGGLTSTPHASSFRTQTPSSPLTLQQQPSGPDTSYFFSNGRGFCHACSIELTSVQHCQQHVNGRQHQKNRKKVAGETEKYPLYCQVCEYRFSGQESAAQHFISVKHRQKAEVLEGCETLKQVDQGRVVKKDGSIWFACDVCKKLLNTNEQFEIHKQSPRHKDMMQRTTNTGEAVVFQRGSSASPEIEAILSGNVSTQLTSGGGIPQSTMTVPGISGMATQQASAEELIAANRDHLTFGPDHVESHGGGGGSEGRPSSSALYALRNSSQLQNGSKNHTFHANNVSGTAGSFGLGLQFSSANDDLVTTSGSVGHRSAGSGNTGGSGAREESSESVPQSDSSSAQGTGHMAEERSWGEGHNIEGSRGQSATVTSDMMATSCPNRRSNSVTQGVMSMEGMDRSTQDFDAAAARFEDTEESNMNITGEETVDDITHSMTSLAISDDQGQTDMPHKSSKPGFRYHCPLCDKHFNTRANYDAHVQGKLHMINKAKSPVMVRDLGPVKKEGFSDEDVDTASCFVKTCARTYQIELAEKALAHDTLVYLPTGTGKTHVAAVTMCAMLTANPRRPVMFLVDKVLLVMQQAKYLKEQLGHKKYHRPSFLNDHDLVERELAVKVICGGLQNRSPHPVWRHDVLVTTAAFCDNMLTNGTIRWEDFSLVVLDEVHHSVKSHPYHKLLTHRHRPLPYAHRPKMLGLSASPAGKATVDQTKDMLKKLLGNIGSAKIAIVEDELSLDNLKCFKSDAELHTIFVPLSTKEHELKRCLLTYFIQCYAKFAQLSASLKDKREPPCSYFLEAVNNPQDERITKDLVERLLQDPGPLEELLPVIHDLTMPSNDRHQVEFLYIKDHLQNLLLSCPSIGSSDDCIRDLLDKFTPGEHNPAVSTLQALGLPCEGVHHRLVQFSGDGSDDLSLFSKLTQVLQDQAYISWEQPDVKSLVLVRERKDAKLMCSKLRKEAFVKQARDARDGGLTVYPLVGHGKGQDKGMKVKEQKTVMDNHDKLDIIVATSIAEEGVDFQKLQLVVCMNPPTHVKALVQMRGRARRKGSHFVVLCSSREDVNRMEELVEQEGRMQEASRLVVEEQKQQVVD